MVCTLGSLQREKAFSPDAGELVARLLLIGIVKQFGEIGEVASLDHGSARSETPCYREALSRGNTLSD
jgi:hypothetical protein